MVNINISYLPSHEIKSNQTYFFDNNIWMFLFCPIGNTNQNKQQKIANFLSNLISRNCSIIVNSLILSEFSNAYLRLDYELFKKDYFYTDLSKNTRLAITSSLKQIDKVSERYSDQYNAINVDNIFTKYLIIDYNDSYFLELCEKNDWIFVTDDNDFDTLKSTLTIIKP